MKKIKTFKDLIAWQKAMKIVEIIYKLTGKFPDNEKFGIVSQIRRAAISIPSNIAEGFGRQSTKDYVRFLQIALGSLYEMQTQTEISFRLGFITENENKEIILLIDEEERILTFLIRGVKKSSKLD